MALMHRIRAVASIRPACGDIAVSVSFLIDIVIVVVIIIITITMTIFAIIHVHLLRSVIAILAVVVAAFILLSTTRAYASSVSTRGVKARGAAVMQCSRKLEGEGDGRINIQGRTVLLIPFCVTFVGTFLAIIAVSAAATGCAGFEVLGRRFRLRSSLKLLEVNVVPITIVDT